MTERFWIDDDATADVVNSYSWTYDGLNRLTDEVFTTNLDDVLNGVSRAETWGLAAPSSLTGTNRPAKDYHDHYSFDLTGNRLSKAMDLGNDGSVEEVANSTYDANDRLLVEQVPHTLPPGVPGPEQVSRRTTYGYDHTQQIDKTVYIGANANDPLTITSSMHFAYDLQGHLSVATNSTFNGSDGTRLTAERTAYGYDATGIRVSATTEMLDPADATNGTVQATERVEFLNDPQNFTGYSQVVRATHQDGTGHLTKTVVYTFGHDEISQTTQTYDATGTVTETRTEFFTHDGHGSVRALLDAVGAIATVSGVRQLFTYDAYGNALGFNMAAAATVLLYSGEQFDQHAMMQYLRARFYDGTNGRFVGLDPFFGNLKDPQSFHKAIYTHGNPIGGIDPTGMSELMSMLAGIGVRVSFFAARTAVLAAPYISPATTIAGVFGIASGIQLILEEAGFVPRTGYTYEVFAVSTALFTAGLSLLAFSQSVRGVVYPLRHGSGELYSGATANQRVAALKPHYNPPYSEKRMVAEGRIAPGTRLVRVYSGSMKRPWLTTPEEIDGLTDRQIQDKLALPAPPSRIVDVNADGLKARCGYARENYGQKGGGLQIELLDDPESAIFINDRNL